MWLRLDNAAKIYPAARSKTWSNLYRLSVNLTEEIDKPLMQAALDDTVGRFPSVAARLRRGVFWYYLQQLEKAPQIREELSYPLERMSRAEARKCPFRVIVYKNRVALEMFHSLADGYGSLTFFLTFVAEYLRRKYGAQIPYGGYIMSISDTPKPEELEDSFQKYAGPVGGKDKEDNAWRLRGTPEPDGFLNSTSFVLDTNSIKEKAKQCGVSVTAYMTAIMLDSLQHLQAACVPNPRRRKPIKVQVPVNLRQLFPSKTLRNFAYFTTPQLDTKAGEYSFPEICKLVHHWMGLEITHKKMARIIASNVGIEKLLVVKLLPLFVKNVIMKAAFITQGERKSCLSMSNLGLVKLPEEMDCYVERVEAILGVQSTAPYNCSVISHRDKMYLSIIRNTKEPQLEMAFFKALQRQGLNAEVSSNGK